MSSRCRVVICGQSVFLMAIEAGLAEFSAMEVIRLNTYTLDLLKCIIALQPDMIVLEYNQGHGDLALRLLEHSFPLVVLNAQQDQGLLLAGQIVSVSDLPQLIMPQDNSDK